MPTVESRNRFDGPPTDRFSPKFRSLPQDYFETSGNAAAEAQLMTTQHKVATSQRPGLTDVSYMPIPFSVRDFQPSSRDTRPMKFTHFEPPQVHYYVESGAVPVDRLYEVPAQTSVSISPSLLDYRGTAVSSLKESKYMKPAIPVSKGHKTDVMTSPERAVNRAPVAIPSPFPEHGRTSGRESRNWSPVQLLSRIPSPFQDSRRFLGDTTADTRPMKSSRSLTPRQDCDDVAFSEIQMLPTVNIPSPFQDILILSGDHDTDPPLLKCAKSVVKEPKSDFVASPNRPLESRVTVPSLYPDPSSLCANAGQGQILKSAMKRKSNVSAHSNSNIPPDLRESNIALEDTPAQDAQHRMYPLPTREPETAPGSPALQSFLRRPETTLLDDFQKRKSFPEQTTLRRKIGFSLPTDAKRGESPLSPDEVPQMSLETAAHSAARVPMPHDRRQPLVKVGPRESRPEALPQSSMTHVSDRQSKRDTVPLPEKSPKTSASQIVTRTRLPESDELQRLSGTQTAGRRLSLDKPTSTLARKAESGLDEPGRPSAWISGSRQGLDKPGRPPARIPESSQGLDKLSRQSARKDESGEGLDKPSRQPEPNAESLKDKTSRPIPESSHGLDKLSRPSARKEESGTSVEKPSRPSARKDESGHGLDKPSRQPEPNADPFKDKNSRPITRNSESIQSLDKPRRPSARTTESSQSLDKPSRPPARSEESSKDFDKSSSRPSVRISDSVHGSDKPSRPLARKEEAGNGLDKPSRPSARKKESGQGLDKQSRPPEQNAESGKDKPSRPSARIADSGQSLDKSSRPSALIAGSAQELDEPNRPSLRNAESVQGLDKPRRPPARNSESLQSLDKPSRLPERNIEFGHGFDKSSRPSALIAGTAQEMDKPRRPSGRIADSGQSLDKPRRPSALVAGSAQELENPTRPSVR